MPRIKQYTKKYMLKDFRVWVADKLRELGLNHTDAGKIIGVSQQCFSARMRNYTFSLGEAIDLLHGLGASEDEVVELLYWG